MLRLIKLELENNFKMNSIKLFVLCTIVLSLIMAILLKDKEIYIQRNSLITILLFFSIISSYIGSNILGKDFNGTIKLIIPKDISRNKILLYKLISSLIITIFFILILFISYNLFIFIISNKVIINYNYLKLFIASSISVIFINLFSFLLFLILKSNIFCIIISFFLFLVCPLIYNFFNYVKVLKYTFIPYLDFLSNSVNINLGIIILLIYSIIFIVISYIIFNKMDI